MEKNFKYSININQFAVIKHGLKLDLIDCALFDYLKDFAHCDKIGKTFFEGKSYFYIKWNKIVDDMPMIGINTRKGIIARINNLIDSKLLERHPDNQTNGQSMFCFGENYIKMVAFSHTPVTQNPYPVTESITPVTEKLQELIVNEDFELEIPVTENPDLSPTGNTPVTDGYHYNTINYNTIKYNVYNSLKEKNILEKKSEKLFIGSRPTILSSLLKSERFLDYRKYFNDIDNQIFDTRILPEVSISEYSDEDNLILSKGFVVESSIKCGEQMTNERQIEVLALSVLKAVSSNNHLSWSELSLSSDLGVLSAINHPLFDNLDDIALPKMYSMPFFNQSLKRYLTLRKNLDNLVVGMKDDKKPYERTL